MDNKTDDLTARENFLTRRFAFPAWILTVIAIVLILLGWLLPGPTPRMAVDETAPAPTTPLTTATEVPTILDCSSPEEGSGSFTCIDIAGYSISLENVPDGITPKLLQISDEEEESLWSLPTDGIACVVSIAGNLVFYDGDDNLVTSFTEPITLTLNYTEEEALLLQPDTTQFIKVSDNPKVKECLTSKSIEKVDNIVPIYLYAPTFDTSIRVWKPFQNFSINEEDQTMTVEFLEWGDRQVGGGTKPPS